MCLIFGFFDWNITDINQSAPGEKGTLSDGTRAMKWLLRRLERNVTVYWSKGQTKYIMKVYETGTIYYFSLAVRQCEEAYSGPEVQLLAASFYEDLAVIEWFE